MCMQPSNLYLQVCFFLSNICYLFDLLSNIPRYVHVFFRVCTSYYAPFLSCLMLSTNVTFFLFDVYASLFFLVFCCQCAFLSPSLLLSLYLSLSLFCHSIYLSLSIPIVVFLPLYLSISIFVFLPLSFYPIRRSLSSATSRLIFGFSRLCIFPE